MRVIFYGVLALQVFLFSSSGAMASKRALVYRGPGACADGCYDASFQVALQAGLDPVWVDQDSLQDSSSSADEQSLFKNAAIWIQPGGKSKTAMTSMTKRLISSIEDFVRNGGAYVGFCAGAFASTHFVGTSSTRGFDFMPGKTILYRDRNQADVIPVTWEGKVRNLYWEGGPYLTHIPAGRAEVVARYPTGQVAAARSNFGKGKVFVTGLHPEAPQSWRDDYHLHDPDGVDQDLAVEMIQWATRP